MYVQSLEKFNDERGFLVPLEFSKIPFNPKRLFLVSDVPKGEVRGDHAHHKTKQFLICLRGEIEVVLYDGKKETSTILHPMEGIYVPHLIWDSQVFKTGDDLLLVLASTKYDINDYISSREEFYILKNRISK